MGFAEIHIVINRRRRHIKSNHAKEETERLSPMKRMEIRIRKQHSN
jgi:hypothetical protein